MTMTRRLLVGLGVLAIAGCHVPAQPVNVTDPAGFRVLGGCPPAPPETPAPSVAPTPPPLPAGQQFSVALTGAAEVPPRDTPATGSATLVFTGASGLVTYDLRVTGLRNVVAAHLHLGAVGENGPVVAVLYGPVAPGGGPAANRLAAGVLTVNDLQGPLAGKPIADLVTAMAEGRIYVNVHTNDGAAPPDTGPGDFPDGEIRGQVAVEAPTGGVPVE
jgi:CHRD domain